MDLLIQSTTPAINAINTALDTPISITFNQPIDPFTIPYGISLYTLTDGLWTGPDLAILDTQYADVLDTSGEYTYFPFSYTVENNTVKITPTVSLLPDRSYYLQVLPGSDPTRYLSKSTVGEITYSAGVSGQVNILSTYTGDTNSEFVLTFTSSGGFDLVKDSVYVDSYDFTANTPLALDNISISMTGEFKNGDTATFEAYKAVGTLSVYKIKFTTSKYTVSTPTSTILNEIPDVLPELRIISSIPDNNSVNNTRCNPITIRFNQNLDKGQDVTKYVIIKRYDQDKGITSLLNYYYVIKNDTLKIYLISGSRS